MKLLGLDFDNTLVRYDKLFHQLALEKGLIEESLRADKTTIRDHLRCKGKDEQFTLLQGEVYGLRILEADPAEGMIEALKELKERGVQMVLVSHKTRTPYKGPRYDLHEAAWGWLEKQGFFSNKAIGWEKDQVHFAGSKTEKVNIISDLRCTHYIDDLEEVLELLPKRIEKILYKPNENKVKVKVKVKNGLTHLENWKDLKKII